MLQRIQTVFLLLAAIANFLLIFAHIGYYAHGEEDLTAEAYGSRIEITPPLNSESDQDINDWVNHRETQNPDNVIGLGKNIFQLIHFIMVLLNSAYLIFLIFLFKDRPRQIKLAYMGIVMIMVQLVIAALFLMKLPEFLSGLYNLSSGDSEVYGPRAELALGLVAVLLTWMAVRRIAKDEKLVKDSDRLR